MPVNEVDEFLGGLNEEVKDPFKPDTEDPFKQETKVEEKVEEKVDDDKPLPFHKDPKVQRYIQKEIDKATKDLKPTETQQFIKETVGEDSDDLIGAFSTIIGNDTPEKVHALKMLKKTLGDVEEKASARALKQFEDRQTEEREADRKAQEELSQGFERVEESYGIDLTSNAPAARKTRGEFVDFITRIAPKNDEGQVIAFPDLEASWEEFQEKKKHSTQSNSRAKELAARSMTRSSDASNAPQSTDRSWSAVDRLFSKFY